MADALSCGSQVAERGRPPESAMGCVSSRESDLSREAVPAGESTSSFMDGDWILLGGIESVPLGQGRAFIVEGIEIAVFRTREGKLRAIENRCPHRNGPLADGITGSDRVVCPLHGHRFSLITGEGGEPGECVRVFPVTGRDDAIYVRIASRVR